MDLDPRVLLPFFDWLDYLIDENGIYVYMVIWWLMPFLTVWILSGGFWRRPYRPRIPPKLRPMPKRRMPVPPKLSSDSARTETDNSDDDTHAFCA